MLFTLSKVEEKSISNHQNSEENLLEIEQCLDDVLNKNDSVALDSFVEQSEEPLERIREKTYRVMKIFESFEESFLKQIKEADDSSLDNMKIINDVRQIVFEDNDKGSYSKLIKEYFLSVSLQYRRVDGL